MAPALADGGAGGPANSGVVYNGVGGTGYLGESGTDGLDNRQSGGGGGGAGGGNGGNGSLFLSAQYDVAGGLGGAGGTALNRDGQDGGTTHIPQDQSFPYYVGAGGGGGGYNGNGAGVATLGTSANPNATALTGGKGGNGGDSELGNPIVGGGGGGGAGGYGAIITGTGTNFNNAGIAGGAGGNGGLAPSSATGGNGGDGGLGVYLAAPSSSFTNGAGGSVQGGNGGKGGDSGVYLGGNGGTGGTGIRFEGSTGVLHNSGIIAGGNGGTAGLLLVPFPPFSLGNGVNGAGGEGVTGSDLTIINDGTISGGLNGDGTTRANAIRFTGGVNTLVVSPTSTFIGNVVAFSPSDTLRLSGAADNSPAFDVSAIGTQYQNFGIFQVSGPGTRSLTNATTAVTPWTVTAGATLAVDADANLGDTSGQLTLDGGTLRVAGTAFNSTARQIVLSSAGGTFDIGDAANTFTINQVFSGAGALAKTGAGTLVLTGNSTYTGGTTISNGILSVSADANLGDVSNRLTLDGGTLRITGSSYTNIYRPIVLGSQGGSLEVDGANNLFVFSTVASGSGSLTKLGSGALYLTSNNTYTGDTIINEGMLSIGGGAAMGSIAGNVVNNAQLQFLRVNDLTYAGTISGTGSVTQLGTGSLTLTGDNTYTGGTTVALGTLQIGDGNTTGSMVGDVQINSGTILVFNRSDDTAFDGVLTGFGTLRKMGAGTLTLTGNSRDLASAVEVAAGTLAVDGTLGRNGSGTLTVDSGATLAGTGSVSSTVINSGGRLAPGNVSRPLAALTVDGDLTLEQGSVLDFSIGTASGNSGIAGASDSVTVNGDLALNGATLNINDAGTQGPGVYNLFSYGSGLAQNNGGLVMSPQSNLILQVLEGDKRIDLINTAGATLSFWNGNGLASSSQRGGGDGTWSVTSTNWADQNGAVSAPLSAPPGYAIFGGAPGTVTVDNRAGAVQVTGLQFTSDGYTLKGDALTLVADASLPVSAEVRVGDGSAGSTNWTTTINNVINGVDGLNKTGNGTLVLTGNNTYTGGTTISGGTLSISQEANLGDPSGTLTLNGGILRINSASGLTSLARNISLGSQGGGFDVTAGSQFTMAQALSGSGGLAKLGDGLLLLLGDNTYTGGTTIRGGTLIVGFLGTTGSIAGDVVNDGLLGFGRLDDITFAGNISGTGQLVQAGGKLTLTGTNTYTGLTQFSGSTLQIGDGGTSGSIVSDVENDAGILAFDRSDSLTYGGVVSGTGALRQIGGGTLVLTGDSTYTGGTAITAGTLQVGDGGTKGSIVGDVDNQGTLAFKRGDAYTFGGAISGSGVLRQLGAGVLSLTGDSSAFAGRTEVAAGTLAVDGKLGGPLTVDSGATLAGTGVVGAATIGTGAILAPGNAATPIGTLTVNGNLTLAQGSAYHVDTDTTTGNTDKVHVTGTANLGGSVVHVGSNVNYSEATSYTILTADQGINGTFGPVSSNLAFLDPSLAYGAHDVNLVMQLKQVPGGSTGDGSTRPIRFADAALTGNQRAVANGLQSLPKSSDLYSRVLNLPNGAPPGVFKALSGESHASTVSTLQGVTDNVVSMPFDHLRANLDAGQLSGPPTAQLGSGDASALPRSAAKPVWAQVFGNWRTLGGDDGVSKVTESDGGLFVGADRGVGGGWRLGGALGYTGSHSSQKDLSSTADVDSYSATVYGGKAFKAGLAKINFTAGTAYTWSDIRSKRNVDVMGLDQTLKANYGASTGQVFTDLGYAVPLNDRVTLEPFAGAAYSDLRTRAFSESGGSAALNGKSNRSDVTTTTVGMRARTVFSLNETEGLLHGTVGWRHAFGDVNPETTLAFNGSQPFTVQGAPIARDAAVLELGADLAMNKNTTIGLSYNGQFGSSNQQNAGSINVNWRF